MGTFRVIRVSASEPRTWSFRDKRTGADVPMETYKVMVEGDNDPIEINRKPGDKPQVGEVLTGRMENTEYGKRFKKEARPYTPSQGKDEAAIKAMWSIGQAVAFLGYHPEESTITDIEPLAKDLFAMVERVKTGEPSGFAQAAAVVEKIKAKDDVKEVFDDFKDEPVDLDSIPF